MKTTALLVSLALAVSTVPALAQTAGQAAGPTGNPAAASGNDNQAVATTNADAPQPAHGSNSFSKREAMHRIARHGFTQVKDLMKDDNGVWRGTAMHDGAAAKVWLDYKGNVGTE